MARIPIFEGGQRRAPLHQSNFTVRARPEAFGAAAGRGLVALGQGVGDVGEAITTVADLRAQNALKNAQADYMEGARALASDPETGFLSRTGSAALGGRAGVEQLLNELGQRTAETLPRRVHAQFRDFRTRHDTSILGEYLKHESQQTKVQTQAASQRRVSTLRQEAVRNHTDPVAHLASLQEAETEFRTMAGWNGLSGEATEQMLAQHRDNVQSDIILQKAEADPLAAEVYYGTIKDSLQDETRRHVEHLLGPAVGEARSAADVERILNSYQIAGAGDPVYFAANLSVEAKSAPLITDYSDLDEGAYPSFANRSDNASSAVSAQSKQQDRQATYFAQQKANQQADQLGLSGVPMSPGNLLLAQRVGTKAANALNQAGHTKSAISVMTEVFGHEVTEEDILDRDPQLDGLTAQDLVDRHSKHAAELFGGADIESELGQIAGGDERLLTKTRLSARFSTEFRNRRTAELDLKDSVFETVRSDQSLGAISASDMADLNWSDRQVLNRYLQVLQSNGQPKTDWPLAEELRRQFQKNPASFRTIDLHAHRDRLGDTEWGVFRNWQDLARTDISAAEEAAAHLAFLIEEADTIFESTGTHGEQLITEPEIDVQGARYRTRLMTQITGFEGENGRFPTSEETKPLAMKIDGIRPPEPKPDLGPRAPVDVPLSGVFPGEKPFPGPGEIPGERPDFEPVGVPGRRPFPGPKRKPGGVSLADEDSTERQHEQHPKIDPRVLMKGYDSGLEFYPLDDKLKAITKRLKRPFDPVLYIENGMRPMYFSRYIGPKNIDDLKALINQRRKYMNRSSDLADGTSFVGDTETVLSSGAAAGIFSRVVGLSTVARGLARLALPLLFANKAGKQGYEEQKKEMLKTIRQVHELGGFNPKEIKELRQELKGLGPEAVELRDLLASGGN